jgi:SAM-dependent methyltransferase
MAVPEGLRPLPQVPNDRMCRPEFLNNRLRRWLAPPGPEVERLGPRSGERIVDLGASVGYFDEEILNRICPNGTLDLVDIDRENLDLFQAAHGPDARLRYWFTSAATLGGIEDDGADRVLAHLVLCCLQDKEGAMAEAWRVLRPGGRLLVTYPRWGTGPLRMRRARWWSLLGRRPWEVRPVHRGRLVHRHLLEKPGSTPAAAPKGL